MINRAFNTDLKRLNYSVEVKRNLVEDYPNITLDTCTVLGVFPSNKPKGKPRIQIFSKSISPKFKIENVEAKTKGKKQPSVVINSPTVLAVHKGAKVVSFDKLNNGAQLAITTGKKNEDDPLIGEPLISKIYGKYSISIYRIFLYRYDQIKNDHFVELIIQDITEEKPKTIHLFFPAKAVLIAKSKKEIPYEERLITSFDNLLDLKTEAELRLYLYKTIFNAVTDSDFPDKSTEKYAKFSYLRECLRDSENKVGNNPLSVLIGWFYFFCENNSRDNLENDMIGYFGKKFYTFFINFIEETGIEALKPDNYDFTE